MKLKQTFMIAALAFGLGIPAWAQSAPIADAPAPATPAVAPAPPVSQAESEAASSSAVQMIEGFKDTDIKFDLNELLDILRDHRHEGWVLAAYPDPRTSQPLIGAGFSLDLPAREHPQSDPLNPHPFLEPSSAELWQAAGFDPARLDDLLKVFYERRREWSKRTWRRHLFSLPAQISDDEAMQLIRVGAIQAIYNAHAYCRNFDQMTGPQQMAMAQLVYQMGVNLEHFNAFLATINPGPGPRAATVETPMFVEASQNIPATLDQSPEYWLSVQKSLTGSQWAHKYRSRAISVIAMLDPAYRDDPTAAEQRVGAVLRPAVVHRRHGHAVATRQVATTTRRGHAHKAGRSTRAHSRKRA
ncbi:MAG: hypothetical protein WCA10_09615 [Terracidiphilus sp.]